MKKILAVLLLMTMVISVPFAAFADSTGTSTDTVECTVEKDDAIALEKNASYNVGAAQPTAETKNLGTKLIKKAIRIVLKNHKKAVPIIEELGGKQAAKAFSKHFDKVRPQLKALLDWSEIPYQAVHDAVYRGLVNAGVKKSIATKAAHALKEGLSWLL